MALDFELPDDATREMILLGVIFRRRHSQGFRRKVERVLGSTVDAETGFERSEADLLPEGQAIRGPDFALRVPITPAGMAKSTILCDPEPDGTKPSLGQKRALGIWVDVPDPESPGTTKPVLHGRYPTGERGRAEEELAWLERQDAKLPAGHVDRRNPKLRVIQGQLAWTEKENEVYAEMLYRWQKTVLDFARKGWVRLAPPERFVNPETGKETEASARAVDDRGLPFTSSLTPEGLDEAERRIPKSKYARGAFTSLASAASDMRSMVAERNPWKNREYLQDQGAGS